MSEYIKKLEERIDDLQHKVAMMSSWMPEWIEDNKAENEQIKWIYTNGFTIFAGINGSQQWAHLDNEPYTVIVYQIKLYSELPFRNNIIKSSHNSYGNYDTLEKAKQVVEQHINSIILSTTSREEVKQHVRTYK